MSKEKVMDTKLTATEDAFSAQVVRDLTNLSTGTPDDIDRFFYMRFMTMIGVIGLVTASMPKEYQKKSLQRVHQLFHMSFDTVRAELLDDSDDSAFAEFRATGEPDA